MPPAAEIDATGPFRSVPRLLELVRFVLATSPDNETDWIEWKCGVDLSTPAGRFSVAKQILGFANRDPRRTAGHAGGCAFMVLGAEPGHLSGQAAMDPSKVEAGVRSYIGTDGPAWLPQTINVDGTDVVVISVEPPQWGDPIHTLRKEYRAKDGSGAKDGEVFVRRAGGTHPATSEEMRMLQMRLLSRAAEGLEVVVQSVGKPLPRVDLTSETVESWLSAERERLLEPLEAEQARQRGEASTESRPLTAQERALAAPAVEAVEQFHRSGIDLEKVHKVFGALAEIPEDRAADEYKAEVEAYLVVAREQVVACAIDRFDEVVEVPLKLEVVNTGDRNLEAVELVVSFQGPVLTHEAFDVDLPQAPRVWGPKLNPHRGFGVGMLPSGINIPNFTYPAAQLPGYTAKNGGSTTIEFDPFDLRPHKQFELDDVPLVVGVQLKGSITGSWTATAKNRDGRAEGTVVVPLAETVISIADLLAAD